VEIYDVLPLKALRRAIALLTLHLSGAS